MSISYKMFKRAEAEADAIVKKDTGLPTKSEAQAAGEWTAGGLLGNDNRLAAAEKTHPGFTEGYNSQRLPIFNTAKYKAADFNAAEDKNAYLGQFLEPWLTRVSGYSYNPANNATTGYVNGLSDALYLPGVRNQFSAFLDEAPEVREWLAAQYSDPQSAFSGQLKALPTDHPIRQELGRMFEQGSQMTPPPSAIGTPAASETGDIGAASDEQAFSRSHIAQPDESGVYWVDDRFVERLKQEHPDWNVQPRSKKPVTGQNGSTAFNDGSELPQQASVITPYHEGMTTDELIRNAAIVAKLKPDQIAELWRNQNPETGLVASDSEEAKAYNSLIKWAPSVMSMVLDEQGQPRLDGNGKFIVNDEQWNAFMSDLDNVSSGTRLQLANAVLKAKAAGNKTEAAFFDDIQKVFKMLPDDKYQELTGKFEGITWDAVKEDFGKNVPVAVSMFFRSLGWNGMADAVENPWVFWLGTLALLFGGGMLLGNLFDGDDDEPQQNRGWTTIPYQGSGF